MKRRSFLSALASFFAPVAAAPAAATRYLFRLAAVRVPAVGVFRDFRDIRVPASAFDHANLEDFVITGPGSVMLWASVKQPYDGNVAWQVRHIAGSTVGE